MNHKYTYFFLRFPIAMSFLGHGLVRIPKLSQFSHWMVEFMQGSWIPSSLIAVFGFAVPIIELIIGLLLIIGYKTRLSIYAGLLLMSIFIFGNCTIEKWDAVSVQLIHSIYLVILLFLLNNNQFSIDHHLKYNK